MPISSDLTVFVPSRGRPRTILELSEAFSETCSADTALVVIVDDNDPQKGEYFALKPENATILVAPPSRRGMTAALNWGFRHLVKANELGFAVGFMGDDHRPRTHGWDAAYLSELRDLRAGFVYGNDLFQGANLPTQVAFTTNIGLALGWMAPPSLDHLFVDNAWLALGSAIGRIRYLPDVVVEHMHPLAGKSQMDRNYKAVNNPMVARHDQEAYHEYHMSGAFAEDVGRLMMLLENGWVEPWVEE
jgi:hypothetical protein